MKVDTIQKIIEVHLFQIQQPEIVTEIYQRTQQKQLEIHMPELGRQHGTNQRQQRGVNEMIFVDIAAKLDGLETIVVCK
jgi:hypothetical protein